MWWGTRWAGKGLSLDLLCSSDGLVSFQLLPRHQSVCSAILGTLLLHEFVGAGNRVGLGRLGGSRGCRRAGKAGERPWEKTGSFLGTGGESPG